MRLLLNLVLVVLLGQSLWAQNPSSPNKCISGKAGNNHLIDQLNNASQTSDVTKTIIEKYNLNIHASDECEDCSALPSLFNGNNQATISTILKASQANKLTIKSSCLKASGTVEAGTAELKCPNGTTSKSYDFCVNQNLFNYQNAVITDFYSCLKKTTDFPITPQGLFELYSLESAFKPHYSYSGGVGLGQLTGIFVADINQKHRGYRILESVAKSGDVSCSAAKKIATRDIQKPKQLSKNKCDFVQYGEGLERNVLYSLVGLANAWKKDIEPVLGSYLKSHPIPALSVARIKELVTINAYGPGGRAAARAAVRRIASKNVSPDTFIDLLHKPLSGKNNINLTSYITKIAARQKDIAKKLPSPIKEDFVKNGAQACVQ